MPGPDDKILSLAAQIVSAHVSRNALPPNLLPRLIKDVVESLQAASRQGIVEERPKPAVPIHLSIAPDSVACLECGKRFRTLKRHLEREHAMTVEAYRERWELPPSHTLTAPNYAALRADVARKSGLGRKSRSSQRR